MGKNVVALGEMFAGTCVTLGLHTYTFTRDHWKLVLLLFSVPGLIVLILSPSILIDQTVWSLQWILWLTLTALIFTVFDPTGLIVLILAVTSLVLTVRFVKRKRLTGRLIGRQARARRHRWAIKERE
jgi:hypothetical protein